MFPQPTDGSLGVYALLLRPPDDRGVSPRQVRAHRWIRPASALVPATHL